MSVFFMRMGQCAVVSLALFNRGSCSCNKQTQQVTTDQTTATTGVEAPPADWVNAKRAAQEDAYRLMAERVMGLYIKSKTSVRNFVTENDEIHTAFDHFIRGVNFTRTRKFSDGTVEVDAELTLAQVVETLKKTHRKVTFDGTYHGDVQEHDFDEIEKHTEYRVLQVTGSGAVPNSPASAGPTRTSEPPLPEIFRNSPVEERLAAKRAAEADAYRLLVERIYGLRISSTTTVRNFITTDDKIKSHFMAVLQGGRTVGVHYADDGTVDVDMEVTLLEVIKVIRTTWDDVYHGERPLPGLEDVERYNEHVIKVVGSGALRTSHEPRQAPDGGPPIIR